MVLRVAVCSPFAMRGIIWSNAIGPSSPQTSSAQVRRHVSGGMSVRHRPESRKEGREIIGKLLWTLSVLSFLLKLC